jgi:type II secretory pathway pseudopilin PulG
MFSLIIVIISIALVAALALATLYYGGSSWTRGHATAAAATATNQGEQIRAAMAVYYLDHGQYPASLSELQGNYLRVIPVPPDSIAALDAPGLTTPAHAAGERVWKLLAAHQPAVMIRETVSLEVCQEMNLTSRGSDAIYFKVDPREAVQCYGPTQGPFTYVVGVPGPEDATGTLQKALQQYNEAHGGAVIPLAESGGLTTQDLAVGETRRREKRLDTPGASDEDEEDQNGSGGESPVVYDDGKEWALYPYHWAAAHFPSGWYADRQALCTAAVAPLTEAGYASGGDRPRRGVLNDNDTHCLLQYWEPYYNAWMPYNTLNIAFVWRYPAP